MNHKGIVVAVSFLSILGLVFSPNASNAQTATDIELQMQIQRLLDQINQIQQQLPQSQQNITVLSPNGGERWEVGTTHALRWVNNTQSNRVVIDILNDRGQSVSAGILSVIPDRGGSFSWSIPATFPAGQYRMRVKICPIGAIDAYCANADLRGYGYDMSDNYFSVVRPVATVNRPPQVNPGMQRRGITIGQSYTHTDAWASDADHNLSRYSWSWVSCRRDCPPLSGNVAGWIGGGMTQVPGPTFTPRHLDDHVLRLTVTDADGLSRSADVTFLVFGVPVTFPPTQEQSSITVLSPNGGERFEVDSVTRIQWNRSPASPGGFVISLFRADREETKAYLKYCGIENVHQDTRNPNNFWWNWRVGYDADGRRIPEGSYRIFVHNCAGIGDGSNAPFTIVRPAVQPPQPPTPAPTPAFGVQVISPANGSAVSHGVVPITVSASGGATPYFFSVNVVRVSDNQPAPGWICTHARSSISVTCNWDSSLQPAGQYRIRGGAHSLIGGQWVWRESSIVVNLSTVVTPRPTPTPPPPPTAGQLGWSVLARGNNSTATEETFRLIRDAEELGRFWRKAHGNQLNAPPMPSIDFRNTSVAALFTGQRLPTGSPLSGSGIDIASVRLEHGTSARIDVRLTEPAPGARLNSPWILLHLRHPDVSSISVFSNNQWIATSTNWRGRLF